MGATFATTKRIQPDVLPPIGHVICAVAQLQSVSNALAASVPPPRYPASVGNSFEDLQPRASGKQRQHSAKAFRESIRYKLRVRFSRGKVASRGNGKHEPRQTRPVCTERTVPRRQPEHICRLPKGAGRFATKRPEKRHSQKTRVCSVSRVKCTMAEAARGGFVQETCWPETVKAFTEAQSHRRNGYCPACPRPAIFSYRGACKSYYLSPLAHNEIGPTQCRRRAPISVGNGAQKKANRCARFVRITGACGIPLPNAHPAQRHGRTTTTAAHS